ncbi:putative mitotic spindle checkpoint protein [Phaeomoniella chlamydospora]|uniref:Putative mitotic spindle checkpoint protein n=1 Tax=Phaeomoniella chlamydospora TaxID=158046 RepID=A0A0G2DUM2_PHACM|nr:putative mitotic spindle checkpoint protein [Phaeomoniella chlamydospora]
MFEREAGNAHGKTSPESFPIPEQNIQISTTDLEAHFRAILSRLNTTSSRLEPLVHRKPESLDQASDSSIANLELSFTISLTLKADADRPVSVLDREERKWIAAEAETETETETEPQASAQPDSESDSPSPNKADNDTKSEPNPKSKTKIKTTAIRKLEIGELRMQVFVEEGEAKFR